MIKLWNSSFERIWSCNGKLKVWRKKILCFLYWNESKALVWQQTVLCAKLWNHWQNYAKTTENKQARRFASRHDYEMSNFKGRDVVYLKIIQLHYRAICYAYTFYIRTVWFNIRKHKTSPLKRYWVLKAFAYKIIIFEGA